jgi:hypothetical protein
METKPSDIAPSMTSADPVTAGSAPSERSARDPRRRPARRRGRDLGRILLEARVAALEAELARRERRLDDLVDRYETLLSEQEREYSETITRLRARPDDAGLVDRLRSRLSE